MRLAWHVPRLEFSGTPLVEALALIFAEFDAVFRFPY